MEITWYGHSCFRLTERGMATVVTDPYDHREIGYEPLKLKGDIVTISHSTPGHNFTSTRQRRSTSHRWTGRIRDRRCFRHRYSNQWSQQCNTLYLFDFNGINVLHLGDLNRVPTQTEVEDFGPVHVALVPVGGGGSLTAIKATEVISLLEPNIVIPMHYATPATGNTILKLDPLSKFLKEMGLGNLEVQSSINLPNVSALPEETKVVVLDYQKNNGG